MDFQARTPLSYQEQYTVRTYEIDHQKRMNIPALVRLMQEAAMQNVIELGISVWDLEPHQISWVLMRLQLRLNRTPRMGEQFQVFTCPAGFERLFTFRDFIAYDERGETIAESASQWILMDTDTRRLSQIPDWIKERFGDQMPDTDHCLPRPSGKLPPFERVDLQCDFRVRWHDLDFNHHLNNTLYILYMLEGLPTDWLENHELTWLDIQYRAEARFDEQLLVETQQLSDHRFLHRLRQPDNDKDLANMLTEWG